MAIRWPCLLAYSDDASRGRAVRVGVEFDDLPPGSGKIDDTLEIQRVRLAGKQQASRGVGKIGRVAIVEGFHNPGRHVIFAHREV